MPSLLEAERGLRDALVAGARAPEWICGGADLAAQRLEVYRNTIAGTLARALRLAFPTVERLVGAEFFAGAAQVFARADPPASADLNAYGSGFPAFLQDFAPCAGLPYLPDVARLDQAVSRALHAEDAAALDPGELARIDPDRVGALRFRCHPSVSLLRSEFPVDAIWAAVLAQDEAAMAAIDLQGGPVHLLVERVDGKPVVVRMPRLHWDWTTWLAQGQPFGDLLTAATAGEVAGVLAQHLAARRFVAVQTNPFQGALP